MAKSNFDTLPRKQTIKQINESGKPINLLFDFSNIVYRKLYGLQNELARKAYKDFRSLHSGIIDYVIQLKSNYKNPNVIICIDKKTSEGKYWRHEIFPFYKHSRKYAKEIIPKAIRIRETANLVTLLKEQLPWTIVEVDGVEADDIIGTLCQENGADTNVIISPDHDFAQLMINPNVYQFCSMKNVFLDYYDKVFFKFEHLIKGDSGDGIPNIFSPANTLATAGVNQKRVLTTKLNEMFEVYKKKGMKAVASVFMTNKDKERFVQNRKLIDLTMIPKSIQQKILKEYKEYNQQGSQAKFFRYCNQQGLRQLAEEVNLV